MPKHIDYETDEWLLERLPGSTRKKFYSLLEVIWQYDAIRHPGISNLELKCDLYKFK